MTARRISCLLAPFLWVSAMLLPWGDHGNGLLASPALLTTTLAAVVAAAASTFLDRLTIPLAAAASLLACGVAIALLGYPDVLTHPGPGFWALVLGCLISAAELVTAVSTVRTRGRGARLMGIMAPILFGVFVFFFWEVVVRGFGVSPVLMPAPSAIGSRVAASWPTLTADFAQTFLRGVLTGYLIGCAAGFLVAIVADRVPFLRRGLLPLGNFVAALPIVGIAPIMVMWFGFDWPSKAAVVVVMTFFPMLVNTVAGLASSGRIERDLMRSYGATYWQSLVKLRLPAAMPFIFNALKINSTLALIGAIVAEFFGTPIVGMGFRISIEVARMSLDMVWAEIALAAVSGTAFYGLIALAERATTFWHPSYRV